VYFHEPGLSKEKQRRPAKICDRAKISPTHIDQRADRADRASPGPTGSPITALHPRPRSNRRDERERPAATDHNPHARSDVPLPVVDHFRSHE